jgi:hypothetical protein
MLTMQIHYSCPSCSQTARYEVTPTTETLCCDHCRWSRPLKPADFTGEPPERCLVCGCNDLWRQKDFPQALGLALVALGALLSTIAMAYYYPGTALGVLLAFALGDLLLYTFMPDVLVCYRCAARHRHAKLREDSPRFNLDTAERYRQEAARLTESRSASTTR